MIYADRWRWIGGVLESILGCAWNDTADQDTLPCASDIAGRRRACLAAIDSFLDAVDRSLTEELLYCRCDDMEANGGRSTAMARACLAMMGTLRPACSVVELPPPNCADVLQRCLADSHCRFVLFSSFFSSSAINTYPAHLASPAIRGIGARVPIDFQLFNFSGHFRAAQTLVLDSMWLPT